MVPEKTFRELSDTEYKTFRKILQRRNEDWPMLASDTSGPLWSSNELNKPGLNKIVSKQNINPGREICKKIENNLSKNFSSGNLIPLSTPHEKFTMKNHSKKVSNLKNFKHYDLIISSGEDGRIVIAKDKPMRIFIGHSMAVTGFGLSLDELVLTSASYDGWVKSWDIENGRCRERTYCKQGLSCCYIDSRHCITGCLDGSISMVDAKDRSIVSYVTDTKVAIVSLCVGGSFIALVKIDGSLGFIDLINTKNKKTLVGKYRSVIYDYFNKRFIVGDDDGVYEFDGFDVFNRYYSGKQSSNINLLADGKDIYFGNDQGQVVFVKAKVKWALSESKITAVNVTQKKWRNTTIGHLHGNIECWK